MSLYKLEYRVVISRPDGKERRYPKRNHARAVETVKAFPELAANSVHWKEATIRIEQREVGTWLTAS